MAGAKTLSSGHPNVTLSTGVSANGSVDSLGAITYYAAVYGPKGTNFTVHVDASIDDPAAHAYTAGLILGGIGTVFNAGYLQSGGAGILLQGTAAGGEVVNNDNVSAAAGGGIRLNGEGMVVNNDNIYASFGTGIALAAVAGGVGTGIGTVTNTGYIGALTGVALGGAGIVDNSGQIFGQDGCIKAEGYSHIFNSGFVFALGQDTASTGVALYGGGVISNTSAGEISAKGVGVDLPDGGTIYDSGFIGGGETAIYAVGRALVSIATGGQVNGRGIGVEFGASVSGAAAAFLGAGVAEAPEIDVGADGAVYGVQCAIALDDGGTVENDGKLSTGAGPVVFAAGSAPAWIENSNLITTSDGVGVKLDAGGYLNNMGVISGADGGLYAGGGQKILVYNHGKIYGYVTSPEAAAILNYLARLFNVDGGYIRGYDGVIDLDGGSDGGNSRGAAASGGASGPFVSNAGTIRGDGGDGIALAAGGTVINTGTIIGTKYAVSFASGFDNRLVINAASVIEGQVNGGGGSLELAVDGASVGFFGGSMQSQFGDFGAWQIDTGAIWDFTGKVTIGGIGGLLNDGTIRESARDSLTIDVPLTGKGVVDLSKEPLTLNGSVAAGQDISFTGTGEELALGDPKAFQGKIEKFKLDDTIDLTSIKLSAILGTSFAKGVLTLTEASGKLTFTFANPASFGGDEFALFADGRGTGITLAPAAGALTRDVVMSGTSLTALVTLQG